MKIIVSTQISENYAAHDWDRKGECPQRWKYKGGRTFIISNVDISNSMDSGYWSKIEDSIVSVNDYFVEYIIGSDLVDDIDFDLSDYCESWEKPIELKI